MLLPIKIFGIWFAVFLTLLLVYSTSQGRIYASKNLERAVQWSPQYSEVLLNLNDRYFADGVSEKERLEIESRSIQALRKAPLSFRPFLHSGEAKVLQNNDQGARDLFFEVKKRDSRNRRALRALVNLDIKNKKFEDGVRNLDILLSLKGRKEDLDEYQQTLTALTSIPDARKKINELLSARPIWGQRYLFNQIGLMTPQNFLDVEESLRSFHSASDKEYKDTLNASYLRRLIRLNQPEQAYSYWKFLFGDEIEDLDVSIHNSKFAKILALPPYNWSEIDKPKYFSEIDQSGGLYASYADNTVRTVTEQYLRLIPGAIYRLQVNAEWSYRQRQGMFFWMITCNETNQVISGLDLGDDSKPASGGEHTFQVPAEACLYQNIRLVAKPGQYSKRIWNRTNSVTLERLQ